MKTIQTTLIVLFSAVLIAFCPVFFFGQKDADTDPPVIVCDGADLAVSVHATDRELCAGLTATDNVDGDITDRIIVRRASRLIDTNRIAVYYTVFDSASNCCTYSRYVTYTDYQKPTIRLSQPLIYPVYAQITLSDRLTATDLIDGDITDRIRVSSENVVTSVPGEYPIELRVTNSTGDSTLITLTVTVRDYTPRYPVIELDEYILSLDADEALDLETLRKHIVSVRESADGESVDPDEVEISGDLDALAFGSNEITYSYTNSDGLTYSVILTVVRQ